MAKPRFIVIGGKKFTIIVFRVESRDEKGRPERCVMMPRDRIAELSRDSRDNHFLVGYLEEASTGPRPELENWESGGGGV